MELTMQQLDVFEKGIKKAKECDVTEETRIYILDCEKVCNRLREYITSQGKLPEICFSIHYGVSDKAITDVCSMVLKKKPVKIEKVFCDKTVKFEL